MSTMVKIDGSAGEGGGQIIRSSLALSLLTGQPVTIENVRARRKKPGLQRQHLTAVLAARDIGQAAVEGAAIGSTRLVFAPQDVRPGPYRFDVGSAGSTGLVLQTVLPALLTAAGPSQLVLEGGTHNPLAPPFEFLDRAYLPLVARLGPQLRATLERPGFYPAGGGRVRVDIRPSDRLAGLELLQRGPIVDRRVQAVVANLPRHIAERECRTIQSESGWDAQHFAVVETRAARGPGNVVLIEVQTQAGAEVFAAFGQRGVRAERVARQAWSEAAEWLGADVPVGRHLADQLVLPLAVAAAIYGQASRFRTLPPTPHAVTHIDLVQRFLDLVVGTAEQPDGSWVVSLSGPQR